MPSVPRAALRGPTFIRLLARLTAVETDAPSASLPDRLSRWLDWTHAIALSTALDGQPPTPDLDAPAFDGEVEDECARVRASLVRSIDGARELAPSSPAATTLATTPDYAPFRQRYLAVQRSIQAHTGQLRGRLRDMLAQRSPEMARLAEVDAVMEMALSPREHRWLGNMPTVLADHFDRMRRAEADGEAVPGAWLDGFRQDMRHVLLAELDVRFQPVEALLAALRTR